MSGNVAGEASLVHTYEALYIIIYHQESLYVLQDSSEWAPCYYVQRSESIISSTLL